MLAPLRLTWFGLLVALTPLTSQAQRGPSIDETVNYINVRLSGEWPVTRSWLEIDGRKLCAGREFSGKRDAQAVSCAMVDDLNIGRLTTTKTGAVWLYCSRPGCVSLSDASGGGTPWMRTENSLYFVAGRDLDSVVRATKHLFTLFGVTTPPDPFSR